MKKKLAYTIVVCTIGIFSIVIFGMKPIAVEKIRSTVSGDLLGGDVQAYVTSKGNSLVLVTERENGTRSIHGVFFRGRYHVIDGSTVRLWNRTWILSGLNSIEPQVFNPIMSYPYREKMLPDGRISFEIINDNSEVESTVTVDGKVLNDLASHFVGGVKV